MGSNASPDASETADIVGARIGGRATRRTVVGVLAALAGSAAAACGAETAPQRARGLGPATIELLAGTTPQQRLTLQTAVLDAFTQAHPNLRINHIEQGPNYDEQLLTLQAAGTPPDVIYSAQPAIYLAKITRELTDYVKRDRVNVTVFSKDGFESAATWKGRITGLPYYVGGNVSVLAYNRDLFREAGVPEPPTRWSAPEWNADAFLRTLQRSTLRDAAGRLRTYGANQPNASYFTFYLGTLFGGSWLSPDLKSVTCDSAQMIQGFEYAASLVAQHKVMATGPMMQEAFGDPAPDKAFLNGQLAMYASWGAQNIAVVPPAVKQRGMPFAYAPLPALKGHGAAHYYITNGLTVGAKQPEAGWAYMKWVAETPNWSVSRGQPPARPDLFDTWAKDVHEGVAQQMRVDVFRESLRNPIKLDPLFHVPTHLQTQMLGLIRPALDRVWSGASTAGAALRELRPQLTPLLPRELP